MSAAAIGWNDDRPKADRTPALKKILDSLPVRELQRILRRIERVKAQRKQPAKGTRRA